METNAKSLVGCVPSGCRVQNTPSPVDGHSCSGHIAKRVYASSGPGSQQKCRVHRPGKAGDRKSTRLNSSHLVISYAVFCLKKKNNSLHDPVGCTPPAA